MAELILVHVYMRRNYLLEKSIFVEKLIVPFLLTHIFII